MKSLVSVNDLEVDEIREIFSLAENFKEVLKRPIKKVPVLSGKTIALLFVEPSTRTKVSFELAAKRLSADTINLPGSGISIAKGESLEDTALTLKELFVDCLIIRHSSEGAAKQISSLEIFPVINAGDGAREHPTQALLDAFVLTKKFNDLSSLKIAIIGDILHSRVARSDMQLFNKLGAKVSIVAPDTFLPEYLPDYVTLESELNNVLNEVDVLYFLRMQKERFKDEVLTGIYEYRERYALTKRKLEALKKDTVIMHPGPVNRGIELDPEVIYDDRSLILQQVRDGVATRMAVLTYVMTEGRSLLEVSN